MRHVLFLFAALFAAAPLLAQPAAAASSTDTRQGIASTPADGETLPVSLDRIRKALAEPAAPFAVHVEVPSDFRTEVHEQQKLDDMLKSLDFRAGPVPAGGLYMYEQQRVLFNPTDYPLMQPYAAFTGGQLLTVTLEDVLAHYAIARAARTR